MWWVEEDGKDLHAAEKVTFLSREAILGPLDQVLNRVCNINHRISHLSSFAAECCAKIGLVIIISAKVPKIYGVLTLYSCTHHSSIRLQNLLFLSYHNAMASLHSL